MSEAHHIANLWLHKPWRQTQRRLDEPLYLENTMIPQAPRLTKTPLTSETLLTLLWGECPEEAQEAQEAQKAQEVQEAQEAQEVPMI
jgi:hypothetical protein